jgi:hypothetical protein
MKITFISDNTLGDFSKETVMHYYFYVKNIIEFGHHNQNLATTQLAFISFDLLDKYDKIELLHKGVIYELKLGNNTWTSKHLRKEHNLFKLVRANILNQ